MKKIAFNYNSNDAILLDALSNDTGSFSPVVVFVI